MGVRNARNFPLKENLLKWAKNVAKVWSYFVGVIAFVALIYGLFVDFSPKISIEKLNILNKSEPFSIPFRISNNNFYDLSDINIIYHVQKMKYNGYSVHNVEITNYNYYPPIIKSLENNHPIDIPLIFAINIPVRKLIEAKIDIIITFNSTILKISSSETFSFTVLQDNENNFHWYRIN